MNKLFTRLAPAVALCLPLLAPAQGTDPADAKAPAPALRYASAFADYKPWQDIAPADWRAVNDNLLRDPGARRSGEHAGHTRPAAAPAAAMPAPAAVSAPAAAPATAPSTPAHGGHHRPGGQR